MKIKVCGITSAGDAAVAIESGADYIGLVFVPQTPRCIDVDTARSIAEAIAGRAQLVGVFRDQQLAEIVKVSDAVPLDMVQLHGSESPEECRQVGLPVLKAFSPDFAGRQTRGDKLGEELVNKLEKYWSACQHVLLDRRKDSTDLDWLSIALPVLRAVEAKLGEYFLAGGLNSHNVKAVLSSVSPFAVDISSGVEISPGKKDRELIRRFCQDARCITKNDGSQGEATQC